MRVAPAIPEHERGDIARWLELETSLQMYVAAQVLDHYVAWEQDPIETMIDPMPIVCVERKWETHGRRSYRQIAVRTDTRETVYTSERTLSYPAMSMLREASNFR